MDSKQEMPIDQQYVFDHLPLNAQQRKELFLFMTLSEDQQKEFLKLDNDAMNAALKKLADQFDSSSQLHKD